MTSFPWESLLDQLELELSASEDAERRAAICCRLALLHWDVRGDRQTAEHWVARTELEYRPAAELKRQLLLDGGQSSEAASLLEDLAAKVDPAESSTLLAQAGLIWLLWCGEPERSVACCRRGAEGGDHDLTQLLELALVLEDRVEELGELAQLPEASVSLLVTTALALRDRPDEALAPLSRAVEQDDEDPFLLELMLEITARLPRLEERTALMGRKLDILVKQAPRNAEALALAFDLSRLLGALGRTERAGELLAMVDPELDDLDATDPLNVNPLSWANSLLRLAQRDQAVREADSAELEKCYRWLAEASAVAAVGRVYRLRSAQLALERDSTGKAAEELLRVNLQENPAERHSARELERLLLRRRDMEAVCSLYQQQADVHPDEKGLLLRKAAIVAEAHLKNFGLAASLRRDSLALDADRSAHGDMQRLYRKLQSGSRLMEAYQREADATSDQATRSLLWSVLSALRLKLGQLETAESAANEALAVAPDDPLALAVLVAVHESSGREQDLRKTLELQVEHLASSSIRTSCLLRLASSAEAPDSAGVFLERAIGLRPGDPAVLEGLLDHAEGRGDYEEAVRRGLELAQAVDEDAERAADAYIRVGRIYLGMLDDSDRAVQAFQKALTFQPGALQALDGLCSIFREKGDLAALSDLLKTRLDLHPSGEGAAELWMELASTREQMDAPQDDVLDAYARAAEAPGQRKVAIKELERLCRREKRLEYLVRVLLALPREAPVLELLASAMTDLGDLEGLSTVLADLIEESPDSLTRADRTYDLGRVLEKLDQPDEAMARYEQALEAVALHKPALKALQRLYRAESHSGALVHVLELELEVETDVRRRVEVLEELAEHLEVVGQKGMATIRLEEALALDPANLDVVRRLEQLYDPSHPLDLARVLGLHAAVEPDATEQAALYLRAGEIFASHQVMDQALPMLRSAFSCDPGNRTVFTTYEALCYEQEQWQSLMELYNRALQFVEHEGGKAYRPLDLYVRKGQLQLNHLGQPGEAAASLLSALEEDPKSEAVMKLLESIYLQQQDWHGLIRTYEHRATLVPNNELFRLESLRQAARMATGRLPASSPEGRHLWEQVYSTDPTDEEALDNLERIYQEQELFEKLADLLDTRLALAVTDGEIIELNLRIAELCEKQLEDPVRAAKAYEGVRKLEEHHEQSLKALARIYEGTGKWEQCVDVLKDLVIMEADPNERSLLYFKCGSIVESRFHEDDQAIAYYEAALNETPACLPAIHGLRDLYLRREDWNSALDTLELEVQLWEDTREQAGVLARMGEIRLHHLNDVRAAIDLFEDALTIDNECYPAATALFDLFFERGESRRALEMANRLAERLGKEGDPQQRSQFHSRRGQLLATGGEVAKAVESLAAALELRPENLEALDWLIAICRRNPEAYDFATIFRDLEQVYRREENRAAVGHVLVAAGALSEIAGDAEVALTRYQEAMEVAPEEMAPVKSLANLLIRTRRSADAVTVLERLVDRAEDPHTQIRALLRIGEIWSDIAPEPSRALHAYHRVLAIEPGNQEAMFRGAQELLMLERLDEAHRRMLSLMDRTVDGRARSADLSRYAHFLGVILRAMGQIGEATKQFQYALQLDPANVLATIALVRQLEQSGDTAVAKQTISGLLDRQEQPVPVGEQLELRRVLAALHLNIGEVRAAVGQYETVVREAGKVEDRIALAEIHIGARGDVQAARQALMPVLEDDSFNPHALHLLAELHERSGEAERALLVLQVMEMLGWASHEDRVKLGALRRQYAIKPASPLDDGLRPYLREFSPDRHVEQVWTAICDSLEGLFPLELPGENAEPLNQLGSPEFRQLADWCVKFVACDATVLVADSVPGGAAVDMVDGGRLVIDRLFLERPAAEVAFVLGRNLEYLRSGHALLSRLAFDDRLLLGELIVGLLQPPETQNDLAQEFRRGVPRRTLKQLDDIITEYLDGRAEGAEPEQPARWFSGVDRTSNNTGLVASNDISAALRMMTQLSGQDLAVGPRGEIAVQLITDGPELVQFFLSDAYIKLRRKLARVD